jgi:hypothetical protein
MPTVGNINTSEDGSGTIVTDRLEAALGTTAGEGDVDSIKIYGQAASGQTANWKACIVKASDKTIVANSIVSGTQMTDTKQWWTATYSGTKPHLAASTDYYISVIPGNDLQAYYKYAGTAVLLRDTSNSYSSPSNPTDGSFIDTYWPDIYASYTEGSGSSGPSIPVLLSAYRRRRM